MPQTSDYDGDLAQLPGNVATSEALDDSCVKEISFTTYQVEAEVEVLDVVRSGEGQKAGQGDFCGQREGHIAAGWAPKADSKYRHFGKKRDCLLVD